MHALPRRGVGTGRRPGWARERGAVTAETAIVLPVLIAVLLAGMWALAAVTAQLRCIDTARDAARAAARGESPDAVQARAVSDAPRGAVIDVVDSGDATRVVVRVTVSPLGPLLGRLVTATVEGAATAVDEGPVAVGRVGP